MSTRYLLRLVGAILLCLALGVIDNLSHSLPLSLLNHSCSHAAASSAGAEQISRRILAFKLGLDDQDLVFKKAKE